MFEPPELPRNDSVPPDPHHRVEVVVLQSMRAISGLIFIVLALNGLEIFFGDQEEINRAVMETQHIPTSLGRYVIELRQMGLSDQEIAVTLLGFAGASLYSHARFTHIVERIRQRS